MIDINISVSSQRRLHDSETRALAPSTRFLYMIGGIAVLFIPLVANSAQSMNWRSTLDNFETDRLNCKI